MPGIALFVALAVSEAQATDQWSLTPSPRDKCPVCGMFTAKYPDFLAMVKLRDGSSLFFDGTKDMFKYLQEIPKFSPGKKIGDVAAISVKDYYSLTVIDARKAFYVLGSNVYGPMGHELIPFRHEKEAKEFMRDHKGKKVIRYEDVTKAITGSME